MSTAIPSESTAVELVASASRLRRVFFAPIKFLLGMAACQSPFFALAAVGWTYRLMQRAVLKSWWARSGLRQRGGSFEEFAAAHPDTRHHVGWPNWFLEQGFGDSVRRPPGVGVIRHGLRCGRALVRSMVHNLRIGVQAMFNVWVFTMPGCMLWWFGWYDGWNNSFTKGYEQAPVGPLTVLAGMVLFVAAMLYVPMAGARQAATGNWKSFYQFGLVWRLVRRQWLANAGLAALYAALTLPVIVLTVLPMYFPQINPDFDALPSAGVVRVLNSYYFWAAAFVFPAYVTLRLVAARLYATALLKAVQAGEVAETALGAIERQTLHRLRLPLVQPSRSMPLVVRLAAWAGTRAGRVTAAIVTSLLWFALFAEVVVGQFLNHHGWRGWLDLPLVQMPWFHLIPARIQNPLGEVFVAGLLLLAGWLIHRALRLMRNTRAPVQVAKSDSQPS